MTSLYVRLSATCTNQKTPWVLNPDQNSQEFNLLGIIIGLFGGIIICILYLPNYQVY